MLFNINPSFSILCPSLSRFISETLFSNSSEIIPYHFIESRRDDPAGVDKSSLKMSPNAQETMSMKSYSFILLNDSHIGSDKSSLKCR